MQSRTEEKDRPFITSTRRFSAPSCSTSPGPGNYDSTTSWQLKSSTGHKGYGPFVSISSRLSTRVTYTGPGPASYDPADLGIRRTCSAAPCSAVFRKPEHLSTHTAAAAAGSSRPASLAPGQYSPATTHTGEAVAWANHKRPGASAAFRGSSRCIAAPGSAETKQNQPKMQQPTVAAPWPKDGLGLACTQSPGSLSSKGPKLGAQPKQRQKVAATPSQLATKLGALVFGGQSGSCPVAMHQHHKQLPGRFLSGMAAGSAAPGPGTYHLPGPANSWQRPSPMFVAPLVATDARTARQRQQEQWQNGENPASFQQVPDEAHQCNAAAIRPGTQRVQQHMFAPGSSADSQGAPFRSSSPGHHKAFLSQQVAIAAGTPGPAYYQPQDAPRKVSHRRVTSNFLPVV